MFKQTKYPIAKPIHYPDCRIVKDCNCQICQDIKRKQKE